MELNQDWQCCGFREIGHLLEDSNPERMFASFLKATELRPLSDWQKDRPEYQTKAYEQARRQDKFRYALFSGANVEIPKRAIYSDKFAKFIEANKLGSVMASDWNLNPNSGNQLKVFLWTIDWDVVNALRAKPANIVSVTPVRKKRVVIDG